MKIIYKVLLISCFFINIVFYVGSLPAYLSLIFLDHVVVGSLFLYLTLFVFLLSLKIFQKKREVVWFSSSHFWLGLIVILISFLILLLQIILVVE